MVDDRVVPIEFAQPFLQMGRVDMLCAWDMPLFPFAICPYIENGDFEVVPVAIQLVNRPLSRMVQE